MNTQAIRRFFSGGAWLLLPWLAIGVWILRRDPYGLEEEGAKAMLLAWSIGDQIASSVFLLGAPDVRGLVFLPLGFLFPGQILAARILTLLIMALAATALYRWRAREDQEEAALIATGLLLLAPVTLDDINALGAAPLLLWILGAASRWERNLAVDTGALGGAFFMQLLGCAAAVSLHPAGLGYPLALLLKWYRRSGDALHRQAFLVTVPSVVGLVLIIRLGWPNQSWWHDPISVAATIPGGIGGTATTVAHWLLGLTIIVGTVWVLWHERMRSRDLTASALTLSAVCGAVAADTTWAVLLLAVLLFMGLPWLLRFAESLRGKGVLLERGWVWLGILVLATIMMRADENHLQLARDGVRTGPDRLLNLFTDEVVEHQTGSGPENKNSQLLVASPWPARTMAVCRCAALRIPPLAKDPESQMLQVKHVTHIILGATPQDVQIGEQFARAGGHRVEFLAVEPEGVIAQLPAR